MAQLPVKNVTALDQKALEHLAAVANLAHADALALRNPNDVEQDYTAFARGVAATLSWLAGRPHEDSITLYVVLEAGERVQSAAVKKEA